MKQTIYHYNCEVKDSKIHLWVECWRVGQFPMTFTPRECLEEYCEMVGWRFLSCIQDDTCFQSLFQFEYPSDKPPGRILLESDYLMCLRHGAALPRYPAH